MSAGRAAGSPDEKVGRPRAAATTENRGTQSPAKINGDWTAQVRERVAAHDLSGAQTIVDARLAAAPEDSDALGWRAQLLAWT
ncbi:MAG TPA: hypothetical protein VGR93_02735, partial [Candidatus Acidoferrales bacterium]|nr:hypothetical protein [Candidatus Acidoferrales bacterium]